MIPPDASSVARPATSSTAARSSPGAMLSSSSRSAPGLERLLDVRERPALDLDRDARRALRERPPRRLADAARERDVVVLDEDRVVEAHAVVAPAAGGDGPLLERAQAGRRLARVEHLDPGPAQRVHAARRQRRDAREVLRGS